MRKADTTTSRTTTILLLPTSNTSTYSATSEQPKRDASRVPAEGCDAVMERVAFGHTVRPLLAACISYCAGQLQQRQARGRRLGKTSNKDPPLFDTRPPRFPFAADDRGRTVSSVAVGMPAKHGVVPGRSTRSIVLLLPACWHHTRSTPYRYLRAVPVISGTISPARPQRRAGMSLSLSQRQSG